MSMLSLQEIPLVTRDQILDEAVGISHRANTDGNAQTLTILSLYPAVANRYYKLYSFLLVWKLAAKKKNSEFNPVLLKLNLVSHPVRGGKVG